MNPEIERKQSIKNLSEIAKEIQSLKLERKQRRPLLIEFCGSPKSGKSTTITSLNIFLKRSGFKTKILTERAGICPIQNKTHPFFNLWTLTSALSEILELIEYGKDVVDIIIADRGVFDSLCWFNWLKSNPNSNSPYLSQDEYTIISNFILLDKWLKHIDIVYTFKVDPETSIAREYSNLLTDERGSIMNEEVLVGFNKAIDTTVKKYGHRFRKIIEIKTDTTNKDKNPNQVSYEVTNEILTSLKSLLIEKIGFYKQKDLIKLEHGINQYSMLSTLELSYNDRDKVEETFDIQPIPIAVITNKERTKVFVVKKSLTRTSKNSPEANKVLFYIGGHVRSEDEQNDTQKTILRALEREIHEEIGESFSLNNIKPYLIYTPDTEKSKKHLAICYVLEMNLNEKTFKLTSDEFIQKTGKSISGRVLTIKELVENDKNKFESWTYELLKKEFNLDLKPESLFKEYDQ